MGEPRHLCQAAASAAQNSQLPLLGRESDVSNFSPFAGLGYKGRTRPVKHENEPD